MKNLLKIIFVLSFLMPVCVKGQAVTWQKWYDFNNMESEGFDIIQTFDGGSLILSNNFSPMNNSTLLIKVDIFGKIEWQKLFDRNVSGGNGLSCYTIHQTNDSGFTISGHTSDFGLLLRTTIEGDLLWIKKYTRLGFEVRFFDHKLTKDGGIIASGDIYPPLSNGYVIKTDSEGNMEWDNVFESSFAYKIIQSIDTASYYFTGSGKVSKINNSGNLIWTKDYSGVGNDIFQYSTNEIYDCGGSNGQMLLMKIDSSGNRLWEKNYFGATSWTMCLGKDNNILMAGYKDTLTQYNLIVAKVDLEGNVIYNKRINSFVGSFSVLPDAVKATSDSGYIFAGFTNFPNNFTMDNTYAAKMDSTCYAPKLVGISNVNSIISDNFKLFQNYPNPFNGSTKIKYEVFKSSFINLKIYDINGKEIIQLINEYKKTGEYDLIFETGSINLSSGIYFLSLTSGKESLLKKITYLK